MPPADATVSLDRFVRQADTRVIYLLEQVRGVRTNGLEGQFTDREALSGLLRGTRLRIVEDARTGVLTILPESEVADPAPPDRDPLPAGVRAPVLEETASGTPEVAPDAVLRLSPFEIVDQKDRGFQASSVGSGGRLALDLRDTPAAYSVINREFIDALAITDLAEAASWAPGQTFYFSDNGGDAAGRPSQYFSRGALTAQGGADSFGAQRNYYQNANQGGDSYAVETYDFGRGPNAALFGQGSGVGGDAGNGGLGGVSSIQTKRARFSEAFAVLSAETGSWQFRRAAFDLNRPLGDRVAVRLNAVDLDQRGWRNPDMRTTRGLNATATARLGDDTFLRVETSVEKNQSHTVGAGWDEFVSGWDGRTTFRGPLTNAIFSGSATPGARSVANPSYGTIEVLGGVPGLTFNGAPNGVQRLGQVYYYDPDAGTVMNYQNMAVSRRADDTSRTPLWSRTAPNGAYFVRGTNQSPLGSRFGTDVPFGVGRSFHVKQGLPPDLWYRAEENSRFRVPSERFTGSLDTPTSEQRSRDVQFALTRRLGRDFFLELGGDANRNDNTIRSMDNPGGPGGGGRTGTLDLNLLRPDGSPNPGFLDVFNALQLSSRRDTTQDRTLRLNLAYALRTGRFGDYTFNLNGNLSQRSFRSLTRNTSVRLGPDPRAWAVSTQLLRSLNHWSDGRRSFSDPVDGRRLALTDVDWSNPEQPVVAPVVPVQPAPVLAAASETFIQSRYVLGQTTAKWFGDRLVFTGAVRRDLSLGRTKTMVNLADLPANWDGATAIYRPDAPADYFSLTYLQRDPATGSPVTGKPVSAGGSRPRLPANGAGLSFRDPLYAGDRFREDYNPPEASYRGTTHSAGLMWQATRHFSPFFNHSNTFTPASSVTLDLNGALRQPIDARGFDAGFNVRLLNDRVFARYIYYLNVRRGDAFTPPALAQINSLYQSNAWNDPDPTLSGRNLRGAADLPGVDYTERRNWGYEIEVSVNLDGGWRASLNGSVGSFSVQNTGRLIRDYVPAHAGLFQQILEDAGGRLDTSQRPGDAPGLAVPLPLPGRAVGIDTTQAVNAYNNLWAAHTTLLAGRVGRTPRPPTINVYSDYTLQSGRARGLRLGAGIQWQGRVALTTMEQYTILDPTNPIPTAIDDPERGPFDFRFMKGSYLTQANLGYTFALASGNRLAVSVRINNLWNDRRIVVGDAGVGGGSTNALMGGAPAGVGFGAAQMRPAAGDARLPHRAALPDQVARFSERTSFRLGATYTFGGRRVR